MIIVVGTFEGFPVIEALLARHRNIGTPPVTVHVPFAPIGRLIAGRFIDFPEGHSIRIEQNIIHKYPMRQGILSRQKGCAVRRTNRHARNRMGQVHALAGQAI